MRAVETGAFFPPVFFAADERDEPALFFAVDFFAAAPREEPLFVCAMKHSPLRYIQNQKESEKLGQLRYHAAAPRISEITIASAPTIQQYQAKPPKRPRLTIFCRKRMLA